MKRTLLLLVALLAIGVSGVKGEEVSISWASYPNGTFNDAASFCWVGFKTPGTTQATYKMSAFSLALNSGVTGRTTSYAAITTSQPSGIGNVLDEEKVLAISTAAVYPESNISYEYTLNNTVELTGGTVYYIVFLSSNAASETKYTVTTQRVAVNTTYGIYEPKMGNISGSNTTANEINTWTPNIQSTLSVASASTNYTLTDDNGKVYTGTCTGYYGYSLALSGCDGFSLENTSWSNNEGTYTLTAKINFPFPISSNEKENYTYINFFENYAINPQLYLWRLDGTEDIKVSSTNFPTNESGSNEKWEWSIEPTINNGSITFLIKNVSTNNYITSTSSTDTNGQGYVTLTGTGSALTYCYDTTGKAAGYAWKLSTNKYLSSFSTDKDYYLSTYSHHPGTNVGFTTPADFETLESSLTTAYNAVNSYTIGTELGEYHYTNDAVGPAITNAGPIVGGSTYATAATFTSLTSILTSNPVAINDVSKNGFYRIKGYSNNYITKYDASYKASMKATSDETNIICYDSNGRLIFYDGGLGLYTTNYVAPVGSTLNEFTFLEGYQKGKYYVKSNANTTYYGQYCYDNNTHLDRNGSAVTTGNYNTDWSVSKVTSLPVTITTAKYATLYTPVTLTIPDGVEAYYISSITSNVATLTKLEETIPSNMAVILYANGLTENTTYEFPIASDPVVFEGTNKLAGQAAAQTIAAGDAYTLQKGSTEPYAVGFYPKAAGTMAGFRAYLPVSNVPAGVKGLTFHFEDADGISTIAPAPVSREDNSIYSLTGQRMNRTQKGIYIVNGKKVVIK